YIQKLNLPLVQAAGGPAPDTNTIATGVNEGTVQIDYDFFGIPDQIQVFYDGAVIFDTGSVSGTGTFSVDFGPGYDTNVVVVVNPKSNSNQGTAWNYTPTIFVFFFNDTATTERTNLATIPIK